MRNKKSDPDYVAGKNADVEKKINEANLLFRFHMLLLDQYNEQPFIFDPESGNIIFISAEVAALVQNIQKGLELPVEVLADLAQTLQLPHFIGPGQETTPKLWAIIIHLNHACNLACTYCYADGRTSSLEGTAKGAYGGSITFMRSSILEAIADKLLSNAPCKRVLVSFCGGEPLLSERRFIEAVEMLAKKAAQYEREIDFEVTTNGTKFTPGIVAHLKKYNFKVAVSLDGAKETHDKQRPFKNGKGSYDTIINALDILRNQEIRFGIRMTALRENIEDFERNHWALTNTPAPVANFKFSMYGEDAERSLSARENEMLFSHYKNIAVKILEGDEEASKLTSVRDFILGILLRRKIRFQCGAGRWTRAVTPDGDVYPCHRFVGMSGYKLGNVLEKEFTFHSYEEFESNSMEKRVFRKDGTKNCFLCYAHHLCGGGCPQIGVANTSVMGELPAFYCEETKLRLKAAIHAIIEKMDPTSLN